jgi:hypothetical protein
VVVVVKTIHIFLVFLGAKQSAYYHSSA